MPPFPRTLAHGLSTALTFVASQSLADVPEVLVDTPPLHSIVASVMDGMGTPTLLLPPGTSPHSYALRPSDATTIARAELILWVGPALTPWLTAPLETLGTEARQVSLLDSDGWVRLTLRDDPAFFSDDGHDHDHAHDHDDDHGDEDLADTDPHAWLDPLVAAAWAGSIARTLGDMDPANAENYASNASQFAAQMAQLIATVTADLAPLSGLSFVVPHDAFQYFEVRFDLPSLGAISLSDASSAGPAHLAELRDQVQSSGVRCILTDAQTSPEWANLLVDGTEARIVMVDSEGMHLEPGVALYPALIEGLAKALTECLNEE